MIPTLRGASVAADRAGQQTPEPAGIVVSARSEGPEDRLLTSPHPPLISPELDGRR